MKTGSYILVIKLKQTTEINVGSLGKIQFEQGFYTYCGSAFGPGGLKRVDRHQQISTGKQNKKHWHIDYLTSSPLSTIIETKKLFNQKIECKLAQSLGKDKIKKFGCSDCECDSHLKYFKKLEQVKTNLRNL